MRGTVIGFDPLTNSGALRGCEGNRYEFSLSDWRSAIVPRAGQPVDFIAEGNNAKQIFPLAAHSASAILAPAAKTVETMLRVVIALLSGAASVTFFVILVNFSLGDEAVNSPTFRSGLGVILLGGLIAGWKVKLDFVRRLFGLHASDKADHPQPTLPIVPDALAVEPKRRVEAVDVCKPTSDLTNSESEVADAGWPETNYSSDYSAEVLRGRTGQNDRSLSREVAMIAGIILFLLLIFNSAYQSAAPDRNARQVEPAQTVSPDDVVPDGIASGSEGKPVSVEDLPKENGGNFFEQFDAQSRSSDPVPPNEEWQPLEEAFQKAPVEPEADGPGWKPPEEDFGPTK